MILTNKDKFISQIRNRSRVMLEDKKIIEFRCSCSRVFYRDGQGMGFVVLRDFSTGTVPQIIPRSRLSGGFESRSLSRSRGCARPGRKPRHSPGTIAHPCSDDFFTITLKKREVNVGVVKLTLAITLPTV